MKKRNGAWNMKPQTKDGTRRRDKVGLKTQIGRRYMVRHGK